jgi:hypothetical protein
VEKLDLVGQTFGDLLAISFAGMKSKHSHFLCHCTCGGEVTVSSSNLKTGHTQSCGCLPNKGNTRHGMRGSPELAAYFNAKTRCTNPNYEDWADYGGRGIKFLFISFEQFYAELGPRPKGKTLDRYPNNNGHYEPGNVRWATWEEQAANRRAAQRRTR